MSDATGEIPRDRFDVDRYYDPDPARPGTLSVRRAAFVDFAGSFDASFFGISPREAMQMDPQQRVLLEVAWEAIEDGGQRHEAIAGSRTGVFIGVSTHDFSDLLVGAPNRDHIGTHSATGTATSLAANRISYAFDLRGPSVTVDTAGRRRGPPHLACRSLTQATALPRS